jgi:hypothetical protein
MTESKPTFTLYVIFHKFLVSECYETLSGENLEAHVRFLAVNAGIKKEVPTPLEPLVIQERQLPWYNPFLQFNRFCETSAFYHAWKNPELFLKNNTYIGFLHYDMLLKREAIEFLEKEIPAAEERGEQVLFTHVCFPARNHIYQVLPLEAWNPIIMIYNGMFGKSHTIYDVVDKEIPLYHTYVMHKDLFQRMMFFADHAIGRLFELLGLNTKHLPYFIERLHGIFLALCREDGISPTWMTVPGIIHQERLKDDWQNSGAVTGATTNSGAVTSTTTAAGAAKPV